jgi:PAS domain S-box-containing protein
MFSSHGYLGYMSESVTLINTIKIFSFYIGTLSLLLFTFNFLNIQKIYPKIFKLPSLLITITIVFLITLNVGLENKPYSVMLLLNFICLYLGIVSCIHKYPHAKYYLFAVGGYLIGLSIGILTMEGFIPRTIYTTEAHLIGFIWEMIFLLLALGDKIRLLQNERNEAISKTQIQEKMLFLQSRQASVGELVGNIAHQWREPLGEIGAIHTNLEATLLLKGSIPPEKLIHSIRESYKIIRHLSDTIDIFYRFFKHQKSDKKEFNLSKVMDNIQQMVHYTLNIENISVAYECKEEIMVFGNRNEFANAILNIILNAKDILIERKIQKPLISIKITKCATGICITIEDNGTGIQQKPIDTIFKSGVSSKEQSIGIGLFIAKKIIEQRMGGDLSVTNSENGALFTISLPLDANTFQGEDTLASYDMEEDTLKRISQLEKEVAKQSEVEKALRQWEDIFTQTHWGVSVHKGMSNTFEMVNPAFYKMYGYTPNELKTMTVTQFFAPESLEILPSKQKEAFEKSFVSFEAIHLRKDGSRFPVNVDITVIKNEYDEILYRIANIRDITKRKLAEQNLLLKEFALNKISEAVFLIDENGKFQYVNESAYKSLGYEEDELMQLNVITIDPNMTQDKWAKHWNNKQKYHPTYLETHHQRKDGTVFPIEVTANHFEYKGTAYNLAVTRDITERLEAEKRKDDEKMRLFFERQLVGMAITSTEKGWLHTNKKLQEMLGYTHDELSKLTWAELTHPEDLAYDVAQFEKLLLGEIEDYMIEKRFICKDQTIVYTNLAVSCVRNDDHSVNYVLALLEDITEQKKAQEEIKAFNNTLEQKVIERTTQLAKKEMEFRTLAENMPDFLVRYDKEKRRIYVNPTFCNYVGMSPDKLLGTTPKNNPTIGVSLQIDEKIAYVLQFAKKTQMEVEGEQNGKKIYWNLIFAPEFDDNGNVESVILIGHDITHIKQSENQLKLVNTAIDSTSEAIYITDEESSIIYVNDGACNMLGYTKEELTSMKVDGIEAQYSFDDIVNFRESVKDIKQILFETKHKAKDGSIINVEITGSSFIFNNKSVELSVVKDITAKKKFEEQLKLLETAINNASDAVYIVDNERSIRYVSDTACRMLGYTIEEFLDMKVEDIDPHMSVEEIMAVKYQLEFNDTTIFQTNHRTKDGIILDVEITVTKFIFNDTNLRLSIVKDITQKIRYEEEIKELNRTLEHKVVERTKELQKAVEFNKSIIQAIPDMLFEISKEGVYLNIWARDEQLLAQQKELLLGKNFKDILPQEAVEVSCKTMDEVDRYGSSLGNTYKLNLPDGEHWFELHTTKKEPEGTYLALARDITQREKAQNALIELNATLEDKVTERTHDLQRAFELNEDIINTLPDLLFEMDKNGKYLNIWAQNKKLLAQQKEILLGNNIYNVLSKEAADTIIEAFREADLKKTSVGNTIVIELPEGQKQFELSVSKKSDGNYLILSREVLEISIL